MIRNSVLYHRFWYVKRRSFWKIRIFTGLLLLIISMTLLTTYAEKYFIPHLVDLSESRLEAFITNTVNKVVVDELNRNQNNENLIITNRDDFNKITSLVTDISKTNKLSAEITSKLQETLSTSENMEISIPIGAISGSKLLEGTGPNLHADILSCGNVRTDFKSEFISIGTNQTCYRLNVRVKVEAIIMTAFTKKKTLVTTNIPVAETILMGSIPAVNKYN